MPVAGAKPGRLRRDSVLPIKLSQSSSAPERKIPLSLRDQIGLSHEGLRQLAQFKLLSNLDLYGTHIDDAGVKLLSGCQLTRLNLDANFAVSDFSLKYLSNMPTLQVLSLCNTGVSDSGMKKLADLPGLRCLYLNGNHRITDRGVSNLAPATSHLTLLSLYSCDISDDAAPLLLQFKDLVTLDLSRNSMVSNKTLQVLKDKVKGLSTLAIAQDNIDEAGIHFLLSFKDLKVLDLSGIKITPKALADLAKMKGLSSLYLQFCPLSTLEIQRLHSALPGVRIETSMGLESDSVLEQH